MSQRYDNAVRNIIVNEEPEKLGVSAVVEVLFFTMMFRM
jgi:hypothetical protein